ncbi:MAG: indole-3-glycerol phosphate synthase TrpC [Acidimicrobiales bacterium]
MATTYLSGIVAAHRAAALDDPRDLDALVAEARAISPKPSRGFSEALLPQGEPRETRVIAEIKRRSPSKGALALDLDPAQLARAYARAGAACLSVLTDEQFFGGSASDLIAAKEASEVPVLRKDFTVSEADVADARIMGADAILLIVAALSDDELSRFSELAAQLALDVLVEVHDTNELDRALRAGAQIVGVNQRDLRTFEVDTDRALQLGALIPDDVIAVAESGIKGPDQVKLLADAGFEAVLIGETLVTSADPGAELSRLTGHHIGERRSARCS